MDLWVKNVRLPGSDPAEGFVSLGIKEGKVFEVGSGEQAGDAIDGNGGNVLAGFIDVHNHGAVGVDVNSATAEDLMRVAAFLARNGVTAWLPTLVPDSDENYRRAIDEIDRLMEMQVGRPVAQALGVHYEGVFANEMMCGALRPEYFKPGRALVDGWKLPRLSSGVHMTTLAPEIEGGVEITRELTSQGWIVAIGHTRADAETLDAAFEAGARHVTHFFNAMSGIHHRDLGVAGWALTKRDVTFDIIPDGIHVAPKMLDFACHSKGTGEVCLISDSVAPAGLGDGAFELWGEKVSVEGGRTRNERGSIAGSVISLADGYRQMRSLGFSAEEIEQMASANPARLLGVADSRGSVKAGKRADLVAIDDSGAVVFSMIGGEIVPANP